MIILSEHYGYVNNKDRFELSQSNIEFCIEAKLNYPVIKHFNDLTDTFCFKFNKKSGKFQFETNYYIGVDWIGDSGLTINVQPKLNNEYKEIDYLKMLFEALKEPENFKHLENLYTIDFKSPLIEIEQFQDKLTPLLLLQFLELLKQIVRKGLKKSYYRVTENLNSRVKGKILINATIKQNHTKQKMLHNVCQYEEFGYNSVENKILKKALLFTQSALSNLNGAADVDFKHLFHYVSPAFQLVDAKVDVRELKNIKSNPLFKEYTQALKLARLILKRYGYNISKTTETRIKTPPFWIDMTKLFELYAFKKLREVFPIKGEVKYHIRINRQEPDFVLNSNDGEFKMVIDAKYKPRYSNGEILINDARQISGYARMEKMYKELNESDFSKVLDCLVIYSNQIGDIDLNKENLKLDAFKHYVSFFKSGIKLPEIKNNKDCKYD